MNTQQPVSYDSRWGTYIPWFLRSSDFTTTGNFLLFFERLSQRLDRLFTYIDRLFIYIEQMRLFYLCWPIAQTVSAQLGIELGIDPLLMTEECDSETVWNLTKKKVYVKRLKCIDILDYRIFYAYKKSGLICVYCVVKRDKDTYKKDSSHYILITLLYTQWRQCQ